MMTRFTIALLLFCLGSVAQAQFIVYREFFFSGQPADSYFDGLGMKRGHVVYEAEVTGGTPPLRQNLMISTAQRTASTYQTYENRMWYDFEYLSCDSFAVGKAKAIANADTLAKYIRYAKQAAPTMQIGLYSVVPPRDIYIFDHLAQRQSADNLVQQLADALDFLTPSCYLFYSEATIPFIKYAVPMVQEAQRMAKGKKVIAFVAPGYHDAGAFPNQYASKAVWANVLNVIKNSGADGMVIFAGKGAMGTQPYNWSYIDTCGWWQATKEFLAANSGTVTSLPGTPTIISPGAGSVVDPSGWTSVWRKVAGAVKYQFQLSTSSSFSSTLISDSTITDTTRGMGTLVSGTTYYVHVRAKNSSGWGSYGSTIQFSTSGSTTVTLLAAPKIISPAAGQVIDPLGWTSVWRKVTGAVKYQFQLSTSSSFTSFVISDSTITDTTKGMGTLAYGTTYYIQVRTKGTSGWGGYGTTLQFSTTGSTAPALIAAPTIISPVSGQLISPLGWTAVWRKVSTAVKYQFQLSTSSSFTTLLISDSTRTDTTKGMGTLAFNTTFYIRVRSKNSTAWGNYGSTIPFTTSASSALVATGVGEQLSPTPTEFTLAQNYPNPFNPTTVIRFSVPVGSYVNLTVYNSLGEEVRTLVDGVREAGYYETSFDGTGLASGIYFYRIRAGSFIATRKLLLMK